ncbi:MAG: glutaredoxin family protein [Gammaproteobacteria bacterium]|nr:glutaredoxin family protein [Gammaproteobacteria bacterium]
MAASVAAGASAFTWTDANGQVHYGDRPPSDSQAKSVEIRVNTYTAPAQISPSSKTTPDFIATRGSVIIYTTERCGYCRQAKAFMAAHRIPFKEYDVENSSRGRADYRKLNGRGVPIILVGEQRMNGYSEGGLASLLRNAGYPL